MTPAQRLAAAFAREHASDVAQSLATAEASESGEWLAALPVADAAAVVARAVPVVAAVALAEMPPADAAAIAAQLEPGAAAALMRRMPQAEAAALSGKLPPRAAEHVALLMSYRADQAGSRLDPRAPAVTPDDSAEHALQAVRKAAGGALNYVYVVEQQRLCGVLSMRELMLAPLQMRVREVMMKDPYSIAADDPLEAVVRHPGWRKAHALPVVDDAGRFLGVIRYSQFRALEAELRASLGQAPRADTSAALAELFWLGSAGLARLGEAALFGRLGRTPGDEP